MIIRIPWKNGNPDLTEQEQTIMQENNIGFCGSVEELNYTMPDNKAWVEILNAPDEVIELMKQYPERFEFVN